MTLLERVVLVLNESGIRHCLIGPAAMAAHGVPCSTLDLDLLTTNGQTLDESLWVGLQESGARVQLKSGDSQDPLAGVVRMSATDERAVNLIVGRFSWQSRIVERAQPMSIEGLKIGGTSNNW